MHRQCSRQSLPYQLWHCGRKSCLHSATLKIGESHFGVRISIGGLQTPACTTTLSPLVPSGRPFSAAACGGPPTFPETFGRKNATSGVDRLLRLLAEGGRGLLERICDANQAFRRLRYVGRAGRAAGIRICLAVRKSGVRGSMVELVAMVAARAQIAARSRAHLAGSVLLNRKSIDARVALGRRTRGP